MQQRRAGRGGRGKWNEFYQGRCISGVDIQEKLARLSRAKRFKTRVWRYVGGLSEKLVHMGARIRFDALS